jgi:2-iminobutanoate/2-iminopropanoate deaminase
MLKYINEVASAPKAIGPYSQAVVAGNLVFLSGQIPLDPATGKLVEGGVKEQTEQVMKNLKEVLAHFDLEFDCVARSGIFLTNLGHFSEVNEIYAKWLGGNRPARATVQVAALPLGALVEIDMVAVKPGS